MGVLASTNQWLDKTCLGDTDELALPTIFFLVEELEHADGLNRMYLVNGLITVVIGLVTYFWMVEFPEDSEQSFCFLGQAETKLACSRISTDRGDAGKPEPLNTRSIVIIFLDPKLYLFCILFFLLNLVSTALSYFLPIILQNGMGFSSGQAILLSAPVYYWASIPALISSRVGDVYNVRAPIICFNALCLIGGFALRKSNHTVRHDAHNNSNMHIQVVANPQQLDLRNQSHFVI